MLQRLTSLIVSVLVWLLVISFGMHLVLGWVTSPIRAIGSVPPHDNLLAGVAKPLLAAPFGVGLLVRLVRAADPRMAREREARERTIRHRVRRPADGAPPVESRAEVLDDPDPAVGEDQGGER